MAWFSSTCGPKTRRQKRRGALTLEWVLLVTVIVIGIIGGLGGFFPPIELGLVKDATGTYTLGFALLSAFSLMCLAVNYFTFIREPAVSETRAEIA